MKATIESTDLITSIDGQPCRVWKGVTAGGVPFLAFVSRVAVEDDANDEQFRQELVHRAAPREVRAGEVLEAFSTRML